MATQIEFIRTSTITFYLPYDDMPPAVILTNLMQRDWSGAEFDADTYDVGAVLPVNEADIPEDALWLAKREDVKAESC